MTDILSQDEIDALLEIVDAQDETVERIDDLDKKQITPYDFRKQNEIPKEQLRVIKEIHDKVAKNLAAQISTVVRSIVDIQLYSVQQMDYGKFLMSTPNNTGFNVFSMNPLEGKGVLQISPSIASYMIYRLLGGIGEQFDIVRNLTEIELNLLDSILKIIMQNLKTGWSLIADMSPVIEAKKNNFENVQIFSQDETIIVVSLNIIIGESSGIIKVCYPAACLKPVLSKFSDRGIIVEKISSEKSRNKELNALISRAEVLCEAILEEIELSVNELLNLTKNDIIMLNRTAQDKIKITIDKKDLFFGDMGLHRLKKSVKIEKLIRTDKDEIKNTLKDLEEKRKVNFS